MVNDMARCCCAGVDNMKEATDDRTYKDYIVERVGVRKSIVDAKSALIALRDYNKTRQTSLSLTKLDEALLWLDADMDEDPVSPVDVREESVLDRKQTENEKAIFELYSILDDISTLGDMAKDSDKLYRNLVNKRMYDYSHCLTQEEIDILYDKYYKKENDILYAPDDE